MFNVPLSLHAHSEFLKKLVFKLFCSMNITEIDRKYIWHPFTPQKWMADPIAIKNGKGTLLFDENGKAYIDAISSWWVTLHGHAHQLIAEKLYDQAKQLEQVIFAGFTHAPAVQLAASLIELLPDHIQKIFYSDNGSTSTEVALKMSIQYWWNKGTGRKKILAFNNSYHGDTLGAMSVSDRSVFTAPFTDLLAEVIFIDTPDENNIPKIIEQINENGDDIACFIYEPLVQGAGGMKMYKAALLDRILKACKLHNVICIADEVMTGFGRTGKIFASEYMDEQPDIFCLSKGLTGGTMALGVTACSQKIHDAYISDDKKKTFFHGHSFTANPLACAVANASLELLLLPETKKTIERITAFNKKVSPIVAGYTSVKNVRSLGTILAFELKLGKDEYLNDVAQQVTGFCLDKGVYLRPLGNTIYWMPPYCITDEELEKVLDTVIRFLEFTVALSNA